MKLNPRLSRSVLVWTLTTSAVLALPQDDPFPQATPESQAVSPKSLDQILQTVQGY